MGDDGAARPSEASTRLAIVTSRVEDGGLDDSAVDPATELGLRVRPEGVARGTRVTLPGLGAFARRRRSAP